MSILADTGAFLRGIVALGYDAAQWSRHRSSVINTYKNVPKSEDKVLPSWERNSLRNECLNMRRNEPLLAGISQRFVSNVVGTGIYPQAKTSNDKWNDSAELFWKEWCKVCDYRQRMNMVDIQQSTIEQRLWAGDLGYILMDNGQIMPVEGERIMTPEKESANANIIDGLKFDPSTGITVGYYVMNRNDQGIVSNGNKYDFIPRENFLYVGKPFRFDQMRCIPELAPVINMIRDYNDLKDATLEKARNDAKMVAIITANTAMGPGRLGPRGVATEVNSPQLEKFENGQIHYIKNGESVQSYESKTPNSQYASFTEGILRAIGASLGLPYEFVLLDFSKGSYSSSRTALLQTYRTFEAWQEWMARTMLQRLWNWRIAKAIKRGELKQAPVDDRGVSQWYQVQWAFPEFGWVDPQNEAQANLLKWQLGTDTITNMNKKNGRDVEDVFEEKASEIAIAEQKAQEVNAKHGTSLTWRDIISAQIPGQASPQAPVDPVKTTKESNATTQTI